MTVEFFAEGKPLTQGSKVPMGRTKTGRQILVESQDIKRGGRCANALKAWRECIALSAKIAAKRQGFEMTEGLVSIQYQIFFTVPPSYLLKDGRTSSRCPRKPRSLDPDKLIRAVNDAITGVLIRNDNQVADGAWSVRWAIDGQPEGVGVVLEVADG